jgi:hypothetical protein
MEWFRTDWDNRFNNLNSSNFSVWAVTDSSQCSEHGFEVFIPQESAPSYLENPASKFSLHHSAA